MTMQVHYPTAPTAPPTASSVPPTARPTGPPTATPAGFTARVVDGVDRISDHDWRRLTRGLGLYSSPRWLRSLEDDPWHDVWYLVADDPAGRPRAVLPVYLAGEQTAVAADSFYDPATVFFADEPAAARRWQPTLMVGGRAGYDTELIIDPLMSPRQRAEIVSVLMARLDRMSTAWGVDTRAAMYLSARTAADLAPHFTTAPLLTGVCATVDLDGISDLDGLLATMTRHRRGRIRRERRDFAATGLTLRWTTLAAAANALAPLLAGHHQRYGHPDTPPLMQTYLQGQAAELDDLSRVLLCRDGDDVIGGLLAYVWDGIWYARLAAAGAGLRDRGGAFFSLVFYAPLEAALAEGARSFVLGPSSVGTKLKRGATPETRWSLLHAGGPASELVGLDHRWNTDRTADWSRELGEDYVI